MASGVLNMTRGLGTALGLAVTASVFTATGGVSDGASGAAHAFSVTAVVLGVVAAGAGLLSLVRPSGELSSAPLAAVE
jgi:hypothetical protein